jgi:hypothetical protein
LKYNVDIWGGLLAIPHVEARTTYFVAKKPWFVDSTRNYSVYMNRTLSMKASCGFLSSEASIGCSHRVKILKKGSQVLLRLYRPFAKFHKEIIIPSDATLEGAAVGNIGVCHS